MNFNFLFFRDKMWKFTDIPPNRTVVETSKVKSSNAQFASDIVKNLKTEISTDVQKTREDLFETDHMFENGKKVTTSKSIITRVFTVRQEIKQGMIAYFIYF